MKVAGRFESRGRVGFKKTDQVKFLGVSMESHKVILKDLKKKKNMYIAAYAFQGRKRTFLFLI